MIPFEFKIGIQKNCQIMALKEGQWSYWELKSESKLQSKYSISHDPKILEPEAWEGLTIWMCIQPKWFRSTETLGSNNSHPGWVFTHSHQWFCYVQTLESNSPAGRVFTHSHQWFWSAQTLRATHWLDGCSPILVSGSDLIKHWRVTHSLDECSPILVSGSDVLKYWRATHSLDGCSPFLSVDLLKHWRVTHILDVHPFSSVVLICSNIGE